MNLHIDSIEPITSKCEINDQGEIINKYLLQVLFNDKYLTIDITDAIMNAITEELRKQNDN